MPSRCAVPAPAASPVIIAARIPCRSSNDGMPGATAPPPPSGQSMEIGASPCSARIEFTG